MTAASPEEWWSICPFLNSDNFFFMFSYVWLWLLPFAYGNSHFPPDFVGFWVFYVWTVSKVLMISNNGVSLDVTANFSPLLRTVSSVVINVRENKDNTVTHYSKPPDLYGLPKIHKKNLLLRHITSYQYSPTYQLTKFLLILFAPLQGKSDNFINNSAHFTGIIKRIEIRPLYKL